MWASLDYCMFNALVFVTFQWVLLPQNLFTFKIHYQITQWSLADSSLLFCSSSLGNSSFSSSVFSVNLFDVLYISLLKIQILIWVKILTWFLNLWICISLFVCLWFLSLSLSSLFSLQSDLSSLTPSLSSPLSPSLKLNSNNHMMYLHSVIVSISSSCSIFKGNSSVSVFSTKHTSKLALVPLTKWTAGIFKFLNKFWFLSRAQKCMPQLCSVDQVLNKTHLRWQFATKYKQSGTNLSVM